MSIQSKAKQICQSVIRAFRGDLPAPTPTPSLAETIHAAKQAEIDRHAQQAEIQAMRAKLLYLTDLIKDSRTSHELQYETILERASEMVEAKQMMGTGPWLASEARPFADLPELPEKLKKLREAQPVGAIGAFGDIELALQNVEWRREINLSWMEFSRWGIQQIILMSRLNYLKHPWIRRGVNLSAAYVFGQGFELSSPNPHAQEILKRFVKRNKSCLGLIALIDAERKKSYDGNLFWVLFADKDNTGDVNVRMIDATEIQDIICDPDDSDIPWYYRRTWTARNFDIKTGAMSTVQQDAWYPALGYEPAVKPAVINSVKVLWDHPIHHRKCGAVAKWHFGCPRVYPALDWAREGRRFLEAFASVWQALRQYAAKITSKGGMQALEGIKNQLGTTVGPSTPIWDTNPPAIAGSVFASGPGTTLEAFKTTGAGGDAEDIKEFRNMVACCLEIPPTWLGDMETSNLSTAQTLDRPTELGFLTKQEEWQEDLVVLGAYQLKVSAGAIKGKLREAYGAAVSHLEIREAERKMKDCHWVYEASKKQTDNVIEIMATFPAIREGDVPAQVAATVMSMTLGNKGGQIIGIDEKAGVLRLSQLIDLPNPNETVEDQYPSYDPERSQEIEPAPISTKPPLAPGGAPQAPPSDAREQDETIASAKVRWDKSLA